jgi:hypothetical protein
MFMNICNHEKLTPCSVLNSHFCLPSVWPWPFFPYPFQFTIHYSSHHSTLYSLNY